MRIQVKTSIRRLGKCCGVQIATLGGNQSWNGVIKYFDPNRFDFLFALVGNGRRWFIPATAIESRTVNLGGPKYSEFEIERGEPIPGAARDSDTPLDLPLLRRGSADVGESGQPVKLVQLLSGFESHLPHSPPPDADSPPMRRLVGKFERTRISSCHQVTIPRDAFVPAELEVGDHLEARCLGPGKVVLERIERDHEKLTLLDAG